MFHLDLKSCTLCLIGFAVAGSTYLNLKTKYKIRQKLREKEQAHLKKLLVAILIYLTFAALIALLCAAVWTSDRI